MFILSKDRKNFINCDAIENLNMAEEECCQYPQQVNRWEIRAVFSGGSYVVIDTYYTEQECKNVFSKLCDKIMRTKEYETIDIEDSWFW